MKKYIFFLILITVTSCNAQNKSLMIPEIDKKFEQFDSIRFNLSVKESPDIVRQFQPNGNYVEMSISKTDKSYIESFKDTYYMILKFYYPNGNIKKKGAGFHDFFSKGIWYEFDEKGKLIKEVDYDKPYKFTFEDILKFCEKENIEIKKGPILQNGWHNRIFRNVENDNPIWSIEYLKKKDLVEIIKLDGITGKILGTETYDYINN